MLIFCAYDSGIFFPPVRGINWLMSSLSVTIAQNRVSLCKVYAQFHNALDIMSKKLTLASPCYKASILIRTQLFPYCCD